MRKNLTLFLSLLLAFSCSQKFDKKNELELPVLIPAEYDSILPLESNKMIASRPTVYGINITDTFCLLNGSTYDKENFSGHYNWKNLRKDSLLVKIDTTFKEFSTNEMGGFSSIPPPPPLPKDNKFMKEYSLAEDSLYTELFRGLQKRKKQHFKTFPLYIYNPTENNIMVQTPIQDGDLYFIIEALDKSKKWRPIEFWDQPGFICGHGHQDYVIKPKHFLIASVKRYGGSHKTKMRVKLRSFDKIYYSNAFWGTMNLNQFDSTHVISNFEKRFSNKRYSRYEERRKLLFLN